MVMSLISLLFTAKLYAGVFNVDKIGNDNIEIFLPDAGVKSIMRTIENPVITIKDVAEIEILKKKILIQYNSGASSDPMFIFYWYEGKDKKKFEIRGKKLNYIQEGSFLVSGHSNNMFDVKRKIVFDGKKIEELKQSFYAVDLSSNALIEGSVHQAPTEKSPIVYSYKKNEELKILISDAKQEYFLIKNKDGLSGWIKIPLGQRPTIFKEIFYAGD